MIIKYYWFIKDVYLVMNELLTFISSQGKLEDLKNNSVFVGRQEFASKISLIGREICIAPFFPWRNSWGCLINSKIFINYISLLSIILSNYVLCRNSMMNYFHLNFLSGTAATLNYRPGEKCWHTAGAWRTRLLKICSERQNFTSSEWRGKSYRKYNLDLLSYWV